jgi:hypothetical protein
MAWIRLATGNKILGVRPDFQQLLEQNSAQDKQSNVPDNKQNSAQMDKGSGTGIQHSNSLPTLL